MDPSGVLLALEEQKKWRERRERIRERMRELQRRRAYLEKELDRVRTKLAEYGSLLGDLKTPRFEGKQPLAPATPR